MNADGGAGVSGGSPAPRIHPAGYSQPATAAKGGMRPLRRMLDQTVLHRIETNVLPVVDDAGDACPQSE
jgi:hypothetical protein